MYATRPISTTISAIVDFTPLTSAFPPPCVDPCAENECREPEQRHPQHRGRLPLRDCQTAVARCFRPDRNQVFLLREPVDRVHEEVLVALNTDRGVGCEVGVADSDEA